MHTLLPVVAPFFLQVATAAYLVDSLPVLVALGSALGLVISYIFGPVGFFTSAAIWGTILAVGYPELFKTNVNLIYFSSCVVSWWLSTICSEQYQQKIVDFEDMISSMYKKNIELEKHARDAFTVIRDERKDHEKKVVDFDTQIQDLHKELSAHRHHLSLAWQETSILREETDKQKKQLMASYEGVQTQSLYYLQQKQVAESRWEDVKKQLDGLQKEYDEKQNQFLEEFQSLQGQIVYLKEICVQKDQAIASLQEQSKEFQNQEFSNSTAPIDDVIQSEESQELAVYWETLYKQLRSQFDEKSIVLTETRKELFHVESQLLTLKNREDDLLHSESDDEKRLISHLQTLGQECQDLEEQVLFLQDIVSSLQEKKKSTRSKKEKRSDDTAIALENLLDSANIREDSLFSL